MKIDIAISTCPNDTYIFGAMLTEQIKSEHKFVPFMDDVQVLNRMAIKNSSDILKVSYGVVPQILDNYKILRTGGALGFGCGPLVISKENRDISSLKRIAIPGVNTSAFRFFKMFFGEDFHFIQLRFDKIMPAVISGEVDAGVVIHEGRFVYQQMGLSKLCDLGEMYEDKFKSPIPLGCIVISKSILSEAEKITYTIRKSIEFAENNYDLVLPFIRENAMELDDDVIRQHVELYVNQYSVDVSPAIPALCKFLDTDESVFV
ncbi:protein of unknown function DUF191 [Denitrovibrio acetiphilus DSM 12809]|uniref:1,4-dihydroxy-6-naphtoate synthase n=1 Tax=Denitrovibrio acetiphilus (strain DSM 12809 / NBRC 114555 / N2460) TaxID=522772 RepID=D4H823_DENA2|nr:1,4-dihydroxy-6-naphthoate synthase [Denitrovibrio acetiphilus]ADD68172.1 protein of unknown function DUF191 [Denitrovibrio acetiphilus DSM 12809]